MNEYKNFEEQLQKLQEKKRPYFESIGKVCYEKMKESIPASARKEMEALTEIETEERKITRKIWKIKGIFICPSCKKEIPDNSIFCNQCGIKLPESLIKGEDVPAESLDQLLESIYTESMDEIDEDAEKYDTATGDIEDDLSGFETVDDVKEQTEFEEADDDLLTGDETVLLSDIGIKCRHCGAMALPDQRFCTSCGEILR